MAKEGISYYPNTALIQGAAAVGMSMLPADLSGLDIAIEQGKTILQQEVKKNQQLNDALDKVVDKSISEYGSLGKSQFDWAQDKARIYKAQYLHGKKIGGAEGDKLQREAMNNLNKLGNWATEHKELNLSVSKNWKEKNFTNNLSTQDKRTIEYITGNKAEIRKNKDGEMVYVIPADTTVEDPAGVPEIEVTYEQYKELSNRLKDPTLTTTFVNTRRKMLQSENFDRDEFTHVIMQDIPKTDWGVADYWKDDVQGNILYKQLLEDPNLTAEILEAIANQSDEDDITIDNMDWKNIEDEDMKASIKADIIMAITDPNHPAFDVERSRSILAERLTNAAERKHVAHWRDKNAKENPGGGSSATTDNSLKLDMHYNVKGQSVLGTDIMSRFDSFAKGKKFDSYDGAYTFSLDKSGNWTVTGPSKDDPKKTITRTVTQEWVAENMGFQNYRGRLGVKEDYEWSTDIASTKATTSSTFGVLAAQQQDVEETAIDDILNPFK